MPEPSILEAISNSAGTHYVPGAVATTAQPRSALISFPLRQGTGLATARTHAHSRRASASCLPGEPSPHRSAGRGFAMSQKPHGIPGGGHAHGSGCLMRDLGKRPLPSGSRLPPSARDAVTQPQPLAHFWARTCRLAEYPKLGAWKALSGNLGWEGGEARGSRPGTEPRRSGDPAAGLGEGVLGCTGTKPGCRRNPHLKFSSVSSLKVTLKHTNA